jgi:ABC-type bacteriocin/lantibiotic exporter with double-glycine peptidase domain
MLVIKSETLLQRAIKDSGTGLIVIYCFLLFEILNVLSMPFILGKAINGILLNNQFWAYFFVVQYAMNAVVVTLRRQMDTKLFTKIHNKLIFDVIYKYKNGDVGYSETVARVSLLYGVVSFFESDIPSLVKATIQIVGASLMIFYYSKLLFVLCLIFLLPLILINIRYSKKLSVVTKQLNSNLEEQAEIIKNKSVTEIQNYFNSNRLFRIKSSNLDAFNFAKMELLSIIVIGLSVFVISVSDMKSPGDIYAMLAYTIKYSTGFDVMPQLIDKIIFIKDLQKRLV